jgi:hypothetical protein
MSKATLTIPTPESCYGGCPCLVEADDPLYEDYCYITDARVEKYTTSRHPNCPLVIEQPVKNCGKKCPHYDVVRRTCKDDYRNPCPLLVIEEEGLRWVEIEGGNVDGWYGYSIKCPKCKKEYPAPVDDKFKEFYNYCPSCGVKLAPPLEGKQ